MALSGMLLQGCFDKSDTSQVKVVLTGQGCFDKSDTIRMLQAWQHKVVQILLYNDCNSLVGTTL